MIDMIHRRVETPVAMFANWGPEDHANARIEAVPPGITDDGRTTPGPVSYTHPTLPANREA